MYGRPGWMLGRFTLHNDRTLFLFVFAAESGLPASDPRWQKAMLRNRYGDGKWECPRIVDELDRTQELYFDRVSQIQDGKLVARPRCPCRGCRVLRVSNGWTRFGPGNGFRIRAGG